MISRALIAGIASLMNPQGVDSLAGFVAMMAVSDKPSATRAGGRVSLGGREYRCIFVDSDAPVPLTEDTLVMRAVSGSDIEFLLYRDCVEARFTGTYLEEARELWRTS